MNINERMDYYDNISQSSGHKKQLNYFREIIEKSDFQKFITTIREKYKIPKNGFIISGEIYTTPPDEWEFKSDRNANLDIKKNIQALCKKYYLHHLDGSELIKDLIFYNKKDTSYYPDTYNLCMISDLVEEKKEPYDIETQEDDDLLFPIAVRLSPYASLRDILDYIKRTYKMKIYPLQKSYQVEGVKIGKFKKRKNIIMERDKFIYDHLHLSRKEISNLVRERFGDDHHLDYGYIGKIISLQKKRKQM